MIAIQNNLKQIFKIRIVLLFIFTAFLISCVVYEEENPEFLESIFFDPDSGDVSYNVEIGNSEELSSWMYPFNTYYPDVRTQILYLSSEIGTSGTIDKIAFYVTSTPGQTMNNFTVRMKHTSSSSYASSSFDNSSYTTCLSTTKTISSTGWVEIPLTTSFSYNGSSNLIVDVSFDNTSYSNSGNAWSFQSSSNRTIYLHTYSVSGDPLNWSNGNRTTYVPNIRLYFE